MVEAVEKAGVPNMVWYNYRRVPAVTLAKQLIDEGRLGRIFHYRAKFLQDWTISADLPQGGTALWRLDVKAAGSGVTGDLLAHCIDTALWLNGHDQTGHRHDRDLHQGAQAQPDRQGREGRHRRRLRVPVPLRERLAGHLRIDPLRPRPQGALHLRDQRRERLDRLGPARPAPPAVLRPPRRRRSSAAGARSTSPTATIPTWSTGGCPACRSATSTASSTRWPTSWRGWRPASRPARFPDALETRRVCDAVLESAKRAVGEGVRLRRARGPALSVASMTQDIARLAGVSRLNRVPGTRRPPRWSARPPGTGLKRTIASSHYRPNLLARGLRCARAGNIIGLVVPERESSTRPSPPSSSSPAGSAPSTAWG